MAEEAHAREIGSDFECPSTEILRRAEATDGLPWLVDAPAGGTQYLESGRQALAAVAAALSPRGLSHVIVPNYLCDSMLEPFVRVGWRITSIPTNADLAVPARVLEEVARAGQHPSVLLHAPYFGRIDDEATIAALQRVRHAGHVVVCDDTHRVLAPGPTAADIRIASLRKLLPLFDGAYVLGLAAVDGRHTGRGETDVSASRKSAMTAKTRYLKHPSNDKPHLRLFAEAEALVEQRLDPRPMSRASLDVLSSLDLAVISRRRLANAETLQAHLQGAPGIRILNPVSARTQPSHVVVEAADVAGLRSFLASKSIYCPVHWPPSTLLHRKTPWPNRYMSLPVDHRYDGDDMARVASTVTTYLEQSPDLQKETYG